MAWNGGSRKDRIVASAAAAVLALIPVWFFGIQLDPLLTPTDRDISIERQRQQEVAAARRNAGTPLEPAAAPLLEGTASAQSFRPTDPAALGFPSTLMVDYGSAGYDSGTAALEVTDATGNGMNKVLRLRAADSRREAVTVYVPAGRTSRVEVPAGRFRATVAEGWLWYGRDRQFGPKGRYYAPQNLEVPTGTRVAVTLPPAVAGGEALESADEDEF